MSELAEYIEQRPNICGSEEQIAAAVRAAAGKPVFLPESRIDFANINSAFAIALHMHQPLIPAGGSDLATAEIISNLKYMMDNQGTGDNHNAPVFVWFTTSTALLDSSIEAGTPTVLPLRTFNVMAFSLNASAVIGAA